jgi:hypothetical protein
MNTASAGGLALAPDQHLNIHSKPRDRSGSRTESSALRSSWIGPTAAGKPYAMRYGWGAEAPRHTAASRS